MGRSLHPRQLPAEPVAHGAAHDEFEVVALEPRHLLGEQRHALLPRARHAGDVGAPEIALRAECVEIWLQVFVDVAERVGLARIARRRRSPSARHWGIWPGPAPARLLAKAASSWPPRTRARWSMISLRPGCRSAICADLRQIVRRHQRDRDPGLLAGRPQPVHRAVGHPVLLVRLGEGIAQPEHARAGSSSRRSGRGFPACRAGNCRGSRSGSGYLRAAASAIVPEFGSQPGGWISAGVDPGRIHVRQAFLGRIRRDLAVRRVGRQVLLPEVDLGVDDQHGCLLPCVVIASPSPAFGRRDTQRHRAARHRRVASSAFGSSQWRIKIRLQRSMPFGAGRHVVEGQRHRHAGVEAHQADHVGDALVARAPRPRGRRGPSTPSATSTGTSPSRRSTCSRLSSNEVGRPGQQRLDLVGRQSGGLAGALMRVGRVDRMQLAVDDDDGDLALALATANSRCGNRRRAAPSPWPAWGCARRSCSGRAAGRASRSACDRPPAAPGVIWS